MSGDEEDCCEGSFHCPECGGHHFGTNSSEGDSSDGKWIVYCHNEYGACGWSGPYLDHVRRVEPVEPEPEITDRRGAIAAQKARKDDGIGIQ